MSPRSILCNSWRKAACEVIRVELTERIKSSFFNPALAAADPGLTEST